MAGSKSNRVGLKSKEEKRADKSPAAPGFPLRGALRDSEWGFFPDEKDSVKSLFGQSFGVCTCANRDAVREGRKVCASRGVEPEHSRAFVPSQVVNPLHPGTGDGLMGRSQPWDEAQAASTAPVP